ncbi:MAG: acyl dehydratase [uncultured archaeon A07HB70]|nr:MAG: acyl dehydratase [uncultured archaeon A07HB70]
MNRYFEDLSLGEPGALGEYEFTREAVVSFAEQWDPLPMHVDADSRGAAQHGGLIASGFHTLCATARLAGSWRRDVAVVGGLGIDDVRWLAPVRPGDRMAVTYELTELRRSESQPERGVMVGRVTGRVDGDDVIAYDDAGLVACADDENGGD